jgi:hypothetical protein
LLRRGLHPSFPIYPRRGCKFSCKQHPSPSSGTQEQLRCPHPSQRQRHPRTLQPNSDLC